jgi:hypothetical protein
MIENIEVGKWYSLNKKAVRVSTFNDWAGEVFLIVDDVDAEGNAKTDYIKTTADAFCAHAVEIPNFVDRWTPIVDEAVKVYRETMYKHRNDMPLFEAERVAMSAALNSTEGKL